VIINLDFLTFEDETDIAETTFFPQLTASFATPSPA
jgi:hypothetical protein